MNKVIILKAFIAGVLLFLILITIGCSRVVQEILSTDTIAPASIGLKGNINMTEDSLGDADFYGELQNTGGRNASFIKITITMKNASGNVIDTDSSYIEGTVLALGSGTETNTCLKPSEYGAFLVNTTTDYANVASYTYNIEWDTYDTSNPSASLGIVGSVTEGSDYFGNRKYLGEIKNNSSTNVTFARIYFISKNSSGKVVDISSAYVTSTDIDAGQTKSFDVSTSVPSTEVSSYYYKFDWSE